MFKNIFTNRNLIYICSFIRSMSFGILAVMLAIFLVKLGFNKVQIGCIVSSGLFGAAFGNLIATFLADRFGKKRILILYALINAASMLVVCFSANFYTVLIAAFFGMLNGRGKDRGTALVIETALLPSFEANKERTKAFAWYAIVQDVALAIGGAMAGLPVILNNWFGIETFSSFQIVLGFYSLCMVTTALLYFKLNLKQENVVKNVLKSCSQEGKKIVFKIASFFALDSLGSGFLTSALVSFYLYERFGVGVETLGLLFFFARCLNASSYFVSVWLSKRIGLVNTMVFSHTPSHLLLIAIALIPSFPVVVALFLLRELLVEMDVPTRQSYLMAVIKPEDRVFASGISQVVRMAGWAFGPALAGLFMHYFDTVAPLYIGAGIKITYDTLLYWSFRKIKPPEEKEVALVA